MSNLTRHCAFCKKEIEAGEQYNRLFLNIQSIKPGGKETGGRATTHACREIEITCSSCSSLRYHEDIRYFISGKGPVSVTIGVKQNGEFYMAEEAWGVTSNYLIFTDVLKEHLGIFREAIGAKPGHPVHILWKLRELFAGQDAYWRIHDFLKKQKIPHQSGVFRTGFDD